MKLEDLIIGDIVQHVGTGVGYVVVHRNPLMASRMVFLTNPDEWERIVVKRPKITIPVRRGILVKK